MAKPEKFVFVCTNNRPEGHPRGSCSNKGAGAVVLKFAEALDKQGLIGKVALINSGCMGPCFEGPLVAIFPGDYWYKEVSPEDVAEIVSDHLVGGNPVERLTMNDDDWD